MRYRINLEESGVTDEVLRRINLFYTISGVLAFILGLIVLVYSIILGHFLIGILLGILIFSINIYFYEVIGSRFLKKQVCPKCSSPVGALEYGKNGFILKCLECGKLTETGYSHLYLGGPIHRIQDHDPFDLLTEVSSNSDT